MQGSQALLMALHSQKGWEKMLLFAQKRLLFGWIRSICRALGNKHTT